MKDLRDKVAVITGAASGFGRELALLCAGEGMRLVLADVDMRGLEATQALLPAGTQAHLQVCDVSKAAAVQDLATQTYQRYGAAHLLFNNAGVGVAGPIWTTTADDWQWVMGVNLMGVVHGIQSFVPRMIEQGGEAHVVNTASVAGLLSVPGSSVYCASKHAVVTVSECLHHDLQLFQSKIGVSVLCPAFVPTGIADSGRNRPAELSAGNPLAKPFEDRGRKAVQSGKLSAADIARATMEAVKDNRFYIITHQKIKGAVETRLQDILQERTPASPMP